MRISTMRLDRRVAELAFAKKIRLGDALGGENKRIHKKRDFLCVRNEIPFLMYVWVKNILLNK